MDLLGPVSLGTNLCKGYSLEQALDIIRDCGFTYVELSSIINMCEHIDPKQITPEYSVYVKQLLEKRGLKCHAVSGHVDLTEDEQLQDFLKKIEFAGRIGAGIINTNSGPRSRQDVFYRNMRAVISEAEKWNVVIGLESHGDIVDTAKNSMDVFRYFNHPLVRLNYDTGNVLFYNPTGVTIEEDIKYGFEYMAHLHLKDISIRGNQVAYVPIGSGDVNFPAVFQTLKSFGKVLPCGYEIPVHVRGVLGRIGPVDTPMPVHAIKQAVRESVDYVSGF